MKIIFFAAAFFACVNFADAQLQASPLKKLDSVAAKVVNYLKNKQPDSVYAMTGKAFRDKITAENFSSIATNQIFPINDFSHVTYVSTMQTINKYKVEGTPELQLLIGLDVDDKIQTLLIQPYSGD